MAGWMSANCQTNTIVSLIADWAISVIVEVSLVKLRIDNGSKLTRGRYNHPSTGRLRKGEYCMTKSKEHLKKAFNRYHEYELCVKDLLENQTVRSMEEFIHHSNVSCFDHSIHVSYKSYAMCRRLGLDYRSAARGALLHDLFLYDWHTHKPSQGLHGFAHPHIALENADKIATLNAIERDIIVKHMWPLTLGLPRYKESFVVMIADKICTILEMMQFRHKIHLSK